MRIVAVGYYPSYINTDLYVGNTGRSVLNRAGRNTAIAGAHNTLSEMQSPLVPIEGVPKVYSNAETERVIKTPQEMQEDREIAMEVLKGKTPRNAENLNPHLEKMIEEQLHPEDAEGAQTDGIDEVGLDSAQNDGIEEIEDEECQTCENRKYVDGSNEGNVSFKSAQSIAPESAASRVLAHEYEHVRNAMREDQKEDAELVSVSVSLKTAICPECGKAYVAGGETRTTMRYGEESSAVQETAETVTDTQGNEVAA